MSNRSNYPGDQLPVSRKAAAALALLLSGVKDLPTIAASVGLSIEEVQHIDSAQTPAVRQLAVGGLPKDFYYRLLKKVVCPGCGARIFLVPCLACMINRPRPN